MHGATIKIMLNTVSHSLCLELGFGNLYISEPQRDEEAEKTIFGGERLKYMKNQALRKLFGA